MELMPAASYVYRKYRMNLVLPTPVGVELFLPNILLDNLHYSSYISQKTTPNG